MYKWYQETGKIERRTLWVCFAGWGLDAVDGQMFSLAIPALIATFALSSAQAGMIGSVTLVSSALGGWIAGSLSDRYGRVRILKLTILWFSLFTFLSAWAQSYGQLIALKALQGFGFGGEWAAGAVLLAETIRPESRGKAMGTVQGAWAVGWGAAVLIYSLFFSWFPAALAWRLMFGIGIVPAVLVIYIQKSLREPVRTPARAAASSRSFFAIFSPSVLRVTLVGALLGVGAHGGYYALMTWLPTYLKTERKLSILGTGGYLAVIIVAFGCGCLTAAWLLDRIGRRRTIVVFAVCCVGAILCYLLLPLSGRAMLVLGFPLGFCAAGIPASMGPLFNELYPGGIRGTGVGFCYNFGRVASALFPWLVGRMSQSMPLGRAIAIDATLAYGLVVLAVLALPETHGRRLSLEGDALPSEAIPLPIFTD
jgi:MFS family permease